MNLWQRITSRFVKANPGEEVALQDLAQLSLRSDIARWRDRNMLNAQSALHSGMPFLMVKLNPVLQEMGLVDIARGGKRFTEERVVPIVQQWASARANAVLSEASKELEAMGEQLRKYIPPSQLMEVTNDHFGKAEIAKSIGGAVAVVASIPLAVSTATVTTSSMFGLITTTVISPPLAIAGVVVVGTMAAFAGRRAREVKRNFLGKRQRALRDQVRTLVLDQTAPKSICTALQKMIEDTASELLERLNNAG